MKTYIYILGCSSYSFGGVTSVKIGSSNNPTNRRNTLQTAIPQELKIIRIYEILNYSAYAVDEFLKTIGQYKQYCHDIHIENYSPEKNGGKEHYIIPDLDDLEKLFDRVGIMYKQLYDYSVFDKCVEHITPKENYSSIVNDLCGKLEETNNPFELRDYQHECSNKFVDNLKTNKYFQGLYYLATGMGKTIIEVCLCLEHIKLYPNENILWITFRNDIIDGQVKTFSMFKNVFVICNHGKIENINFNKLHGKVIVILRQSLQNIDYSKQIFNGIIYDECHDASKISIKDNKQVYDGQTFEHLENLKKT